MDGLRSLIPAILAGCVALHFNAGALFAQQTNSGGNKGTANSKTAGGTKATTSGAGTKASSKSGTAAAAPKDESDKPSGTKTSGTNTGSARPAAKSGSNGSKSAAGNEDAVKNAADSSSATKRRVPARVVEGTDDDIEAPSPRRGTNRTGDDEEAPVRNNGRRPAARISDAEADEESGDSARLPRPKTEPLRVQKVSEELEKILQNWEQKTADIKKLQGDTRYREIDQTFGVEFRGEGKFVFEAPDRGNYEIRPVKVAKGETSTVKGQDGEPYQIKPKDAERWICTGTQILKIDETQKTYEVVEIPEERRGEKIVESPLPFLFGMKAEQAKQRYQIELLNESKTDIKLQLRPNWSGDAANWSKAVIVITKPQYLPREVRLIAPGGTAMRIHTFDNVKANSDNIFRSLFGDDPFKPKLKNYKVVVHQQQDEETPVVANERGNATTGGNKARPAGGETTSAKGNSKPSTQKPVEAAAGEKKKPSGSAKK